MPPIPLIVALARMRLPLSNMLAIPRSVSTVAYLYLLTKASDIAAFCNMLARYILWLARQPKSVVRSLRKLLNKFMYGRKKALLIGIQQVPEPLAEDAAPAIAENVAVENLLMPDRPRAMRKPSKAAKKSKAKSKKPKSCSPESQAALKGPHHDVKAMQALLIDKYGYDPDNIVVLIDDGDPTHPQPTRANILLEIKNLVKDAQDGDKLFFHYAGHADQVDTDDIEEEDGKNELILTSDGLSIIDNELKTEMVDALRDIKCTLTAVLDCCHSGSLLDLPHIHCNDVYVPWLNKGRRRTKTLWASCTRGGSMYTPPESVEPEPPIDLNIPTVIAPHNDRCAKPLGLFIDTSAQSYPSPPPSHPSRKPSYDSHIPSIDVVHASPTEELASFVSPGHFIAKSPLALYEYCTGTCRDHPLQRTLSDTATTGVEVVCISAAKDSELAWEDGEGRSMTQYLVQNLYNNPAPTLHNLMTAISHEIHSYYVSDLHQKARAYKKKMNARNHGQTSDDSTALIVEMHNFQNPQLSSLLPMNMEQIFDP